MSLLKEVSRPVGRIWNTLTLLVKWVIPLTPKKESLLSMTLNCI